MDVSKLIIHKTYKPDVVMNFFDADGLAGKDLTEVNFLAPQTDAAAVGDDNDLVVERVIDIGQSCIGAGGRLIDLGRALHVQGFMRTFVIEDFDEVVEPGLLLQEVASGRLGGFFLQSQMDAPMAANLLGMARLDPFDANPHPEPPNPQLAQVKQGGCRSQRPALGPAYVRRP